ncbi:MAG: hypothetical protein K0R38_1084 [Polyangiaceae bacterium]|nr:hypothetical protein [Polyangiaceae bacterium]
MAVSKLTRVLALPLTALGVVAAVNCSDTGSSSNGGTAGSGTAGSAAGGSSTAGGGAPAGASGMAAAGAPSGGSSGGAAGASAGGGAGGAAGAGGANAAGGTAGGTSGAGGGEPSAAFEPCATEPAAQVPALKRGPPISGFTGMQTAGQIVGVPGEANLLYVLGHRDGKVFTVKDGRVEPTPLATVSVASGGNNEQGLLSMALHPQFAQNKLFYLFYTASGGGDLTIDELERTSQTAATFKRNIYKRARDGGGAFHNGGALAFNPKDTTPFLYFSVGNTEGNNAGVMDGFFGRVLKIEPLSKAVSQFAYGMRNPYRMSIDRLTGDMYVADVANGPGGTIIFHAAGKAVTDYGYRNNNGSPDVNEGILRDNGGGAIIGGYVYRGNKIPGLCGRYFYGQYQGGTVKSFIVKNGQRMGDAVTHNMLSVPGDLTSFGEDGEGELYMASMNNQIYKIVAE